MLDHLNMLFLSYQSINYSVNKQLIRFVISITIIINFKRKLQTTNKSQPQLGAANMTHKSLNDYTQCFGTKKNYTIFMFETRYDLLNFQLIIPSMYVVRCCSWFVAPDINRDGSDHLNTRTHLFMQISCIFAEIKKINPRWDLKIRHMLVCRRSFPAISTIYCVQISFIDGKINKL